VALADMEYGVALLFKEKKDLVQSVRDAKSMTGKLDSVVSWPLYVICLFVVLAIFGVNVQSLFYTLSSAILAWAVIFGNTIRSVIDGIIFLFVTHPFDVGDIVFVNTKPYYVKKMQLFSTILTDFDGKLTYFPNGLLSSVQIANIRRSANQYITVIAEFAYSTPAQKLLEFEKEMRQALSKDLSLEFLPGFNLSLTEVKELNKITIELYVGLRATGQDASPARGKTHLILLLMRVCEKLGLTCTALPLVVELRNR